MSAHGLYASALAVAGAVGLSTSVFSADLPAKAPVYKAPIAVPMFNWTGFYAGVNGGYGWGTQAVGLSLSDPAIQVTFLDATGVHSIAGSPKGGLGGAQIGYNWQTGQMVYGLELDFDAASIRSSQDNIVTVGVPRTFHGDQKLSWLGTLRARLGYTPMDRLLVYATGGLAGGHASATANMNTNDFGGFPGCVVGACWNGSNSKTMWGWAAGAGLEYAVMGNWSVKAEYLYYDLGTIDTVGPAQLPVAGTLNGSVGIRGNIVRAGLNYKFN